MVNEHSETCTCCCPTKAVRKEWLEFKVIKETMELLFLQNSRYYDQIAEYVQSHYIKKQSNDSELKSLETRISNVKREIDDCTNAFIEAKNSTLRERIEQKITGCEKLIDVLKLQKAQLD